MKVRNKVKAKMANTFKKIIKKHKKKKLQAERNRKAKAREHSLRDEAVPKGAVDFSEERMPE